MNRHHHRPENKRGWARIRARAIADSCRRCSRCGRPGRLEVHHTDPLSRGGDPRSPVVVLCRDCHLLTHHQPDPARAAWTAFLRELLHVEVN